MAIAGRPVAMRASRALLLLALTLLACEEQVDPTRPADTQLRIVGGLEGIRPGWTLRLPGNQTVVGAGDTLFTDLSAGDYRLVWEPVEEWASPTPNPIRVSLAKGSIETIQGDYGQIDGPTGDLLVDPNPRNIQAPWTLAGPDGFFVEGKGRKVMKKRAPGEYTLVWEEVTAYRTPSPETSILPKGGSLVFQATYPEIDGPERPVLITVIVDPEPDEIEAPWELATADGLTYAGRGDTTLVDVPMDVYTLTWGEVPGYAPPEPNPVTIDPEAGQAVVVIGR